MVGEHNASLLQLRGELYHSMPLICPDMSHVFLNGLWKTPCKLKSEIDCCKKMEEADVRY